MGVGGGGNSGCNVAVDLGVSVGGWDVGVGVGCWGVGVSLAGGGGEGVTASGMRGVRQQASVPRPSSNKIVKKYEFLRGFCIRYLSPKN